MIYLIIMAVKIDNVNCDKLLIKQINSYVFLCQGKNIRHETGLYFNPPSSIHVLTSLYASFIPPSSQTDPLPKVQDVTCDEIVKSRK